MHRLKSERAQGLIEFAVIFPLLVLFLFVIFDVGLALDRRATMQHAVREGARYGSLVSTNGGNGLDPVRHRTWLQAQKLVPDSEPVNVPGVGNEGINVCYEEVNGVPGIGPGDAVDVTIQYIYRPFLLSAALSLFGTGIPPFRITPDGSARLEVALDVQPTGPALC